MLFLAAHLNVPKHCKQQPGCRTLRVMATCSASHMRSLCLRTCDKRPQGFRFHALASWGQQVVTAGMPLLVMHHTACLWCGRAGEAGAGGPLQLLAGQAGALESLLACMQRGWMCLLVGAPCSGEPVLEPELALTRLLRICKGFVEEGPRNEASIRCVRPPGSSL